MPPLPTVRPVVIRTELRAERVLANSLLPFRPDFYFDTVRDAKSAGDEVDLVGFVTLPTT